MWGPSHPGGSGTKHVWARLTPTESSQNRVGALGQITTGSSAKNDRTPLAGRIGLPSSLLTLLPAGPFSNMWRLCSHPSLILG